MTLRSFLDKMIKYECSYYSVIMNTFIPNKFKSLNWIITLNNIVDYNSDCNIIEIEKPIHEHKIINNKSVIERRHLENNLNKKKILIFKILIFKILIFKILIFKILIFKILFFYKFYKKI